MVSMVACHARDRGSNPGGPQSFFSLGPTAKNSRNNPDHHHHHFQELLITGLRGEYSRRFGRNDSDQRSETEYMGFESRTGSNQFVDAHYLIVFK